MSYTSFVTVSSKLTEFCSRMFLEALWMKRQQEGDKFLPKKVLVYISGCSSFSFLARKCSLSIAIKHYLPLSCVRKCAVGCKIPSEVQ